VRAAHQHRDAQLPEVASAQAWFAFGFSGTGSVFGAPHFAKFQFNLTTKSDERSAQGMTRQTSSWSEICTRNSNP
jgi:hypothetical protein